jgi:hypothetical protein
MKNIPRIKVKIIILVETSIVAKFSAATTAILVAPQSTQILRSAYAVTATSGSAITDGTYSTSSFAGDFLA